MNLQNQVRLGIIIKEKKKEFAKKLLEIAIKRFQK
jgi:hypothetical protein